MSAVLMTLFAVSILGALGMAVYGLRVLVGRWEQPQRFGQQAQMNALQLTAPVQPMAVPPPMPMVQPMPMPPPVWVPPAGAAPVPMMVPDGIATPPPILLPVAPPTPPIAHTPPPRGAAAPSRPALTWIPPHRAPTPGQVSGTLAPELAPRLARGSIPPDFTAELEPDTDPGIPDLPRPEPVVQRGARYSVVRSSRR